MPDVFMWQKMGPDAKEGADAIIRRKDLERQFGAFWWGVGEKAVPTHVESMWALARGRQVCFTKARSGAKKGSDKILLWSHPEMPPHVVVSSHDYSRYFALVCRCKSSLTRIRSRDLIYSDHYEHLTTGGRNFGQQSTFPVKRVSSHASTSEPYLVEFRAQLCAPYCVELSKPRELTRRERNELSLMGGQGVTKEEWQEFALKLKSK